MFEPGLRIHEHGHKTWVNTLGPTADGYIVPISARNDGPNKIFVGVDIFGNLSQSTKTWNSLRDARGRSK